MSLLPLACVVVLSGLSTAEARPVSVDHLPPPPPVIQGHARWDDIVIFYLLNYASHVASVKAFPGNIFSVSLRWALAALLVPYSGIVRGCTAIAASRCPRETELQHAARAGALCTIKRTGDWIPRVGDVIRGCQIEGDATSGLAVLKLSQSGADNVEELSHFTIQGHVPAELPTGFVLARLPEDAIIEPKFQGLGRTQVARSTTLMKSVAALGQMAYAILTLYRSRGAQLDLYGYAAFGLTVVPYAVMSFINLIAHCCNPDYPALFVVDSDVTTESRHRGANLDGIVGQTSAAQAEGIAVRISRVTCIGINSPKIYVSYHVVDLDMEPSMSPETSMELSKVTSVPSSSSSTCSTLGDGDNDISDARLSSLTLQSPTESRLDSVDGDLKKPHTPSLDSAALQTSSLTWAEYQLAEASTVSVPDLGPLERVPLSRWRLGLAIGLGVLALAVPWILMYLLTDFLPGHHSTAEQRIWILSWLVCGQIFGLLIGLYLQSHDGGGPWGTFLASLMLLAAGVPAIGGFVVVGKMLKEFGVSVLIPN